MSLRGTAQEKKTFLCGLKQCDWLSKKKEVKFIPQILANQQIMLVKPKHYQGDYCLINSLFFSAVQFRFNKYGGIVH